MNKILILLIFPVFVKAQSNFPALIDSFMKAQVAINNFNGNVLVAKSGNILYQKAFGYRNYETKELLDIHSVFELASVSKQFTAMGILLLKEKGKLALSDSLRKFFPELPYHHVTIQHLLTHTSGLPDYETNMAKKWDRKKIAFNNDVIAFLAKEKIPFNFTPGSKWEYSNTAFQMLASIIEKVANQSFHDYMQQNIFTPLNMKHTRVYNTRRSTKDTIPNYAYGYVYSDSLKKYILPDSLAAYDFVIYLDGIQGDGIINSTIGDLLKWDRAIKNHTLLNKHSQEAMLSPQSTDSASKNSYGYGVFIVKNKFGEEITHSGGWPGYATSLSRNVKEDITIIVLSNNSSNVTSISFALTHILFNEPVIFPYIHKETSIDTTTLNNYTGKYEGVGAFEIIKQGGRLYRKNKFNTIELKPESGTKFFYADKSDRQIEFDEDKNEKNKAWFISGGIKTELKKIE